MSETALNKVFELPLFRFRDMYASSNLCNLLMCISQKHLFNRNRFTRFLVKNAQK